MRVRDRVRRHGAGHGRDSGCDRSSSHEPARFQRRMAQHRQGPQRLHFPWIQRGPWRCSRSQDTCPWRKMPGSSGSMTWRHHNPREICLNVPYSTTTLLSN